MTCWNEKWREHIPFCLFCFVFFFIAFFQGGLSSASDADGNVITLFFCQRNSKVKESMEPRTRDGWHNGDAFRLLWMVLGEDWGILFLFSYALPSSKIIKVHNCSWLECVVLALAQKGFASMGAGSLCMGGLLQWWITLHGVHPSFALLFPLPPPLHPHTKKREQN
jgi:hypothetical protein